MVEPEPQSARAVLMVRPARFGFNPQTAESNVFQQEPDAPRDTAARPADSAARSSVRRADAPAGHAMPADVAAAVLREFDGVVAALSAAGVEVVVADDTARPEKPDAIFPNNWVSFHGDGSIVLYPMLAPNRREERRPELVARVLASRPYRHTRTVDLSAHEAQDRFLEGTGSLVLDRSARIAYACLSPRTDGGLLEQFAATLGFDALPFTACDALGRPIYHTNVMMALGTRFAVVCTAAIEDAAERARVLAALERAGHEIVAISREQMAQFAANVLELDTPGGKRLAVSGAAWNAFLPSQRARLAAHAEPLVVDIATIERLGGGGVRCMLAEIHLPSARPS
jgi:hypothetical protein